MAAGATYEPIATTTLSSSAATITFSSISGSYTDLVFVSTAKLVSGTAGMQLQFNGDTGSNYSNTFLWATGSSSGSVGNSNATSINFHYGAFLDSTNFAVQIGQIMNYSNTTTYKTVINRDGSAPTGTDAIVGMWRNTSAITQIVVKVGNANVFATGSTFTLYGIAAA
jgi:hypothetical protein